MGDIIGGVIGGIGSLIGGNQAANLEKKAGTQSLTGFNYLQGNQNNQTAQNAGTQADFAGQHIQNDEQQLLGQAPMTAATGNGYNNYLNSTGYQQQMQQGTAALTGSAAARGLLNSGATAKALTTYGQGLAGQSFNNYLGQLGSANNQAQASVNTGLQASTAVGQAGTTGGIAQGNQTAAQGQSTGSSVAQFGNDVGGGIQNYFNGLPPPGNG